MDSIKRTPEARIAYRLLNLVGLAPAALQRRIGNYYGRMATIVMTNVPGPRRPLYLAGLPIKSMMFWVPQASRLGIGVSILSYAGEVRLGIAVDAGLIPDPQMILDGFSAEVEQLAVLSGVSGAADDDAADFQRCSALSKAGRRCKNRVVGATGLCRVHLPGS